MSAGEATIAADVIIQLMYVIVGAIIAGVGSVFAFMMRTNKDIAVLKLQVTQGVNKVEEVRESVVGVTEKLETNTSLTLETGRAVSAISPIVAFHADMIKKYMPLVDDLDKELFKMRHSVKTLRNTINEVRAKQGLPAIAYPDFNPDTEDPPEGP